MQNITVTLAVLYIVSTTCLHEVLGSVQNTNSNVVREKRDVPAYDPNTHTTEKSKASNDTDEQNPCEAPLNLVKPNFNFPGLRISEKKCYDYIWETKVRNEIEKQNFKCEMYIMEKELSIPINVIGGRDTFPGEFPHMGAIGWKAAIGTWVFKCGSSLISSKFMLTAAHCSRVSSRDNTVADPEPKIVRLGDRNLMDIRDKNFVYPTDVRIVRYIIHPNYKSPKKYDDIALLELEKEMKFTMAIQPACLWIHSDTSKLGPKATVTGWGVIETVGRTTSPTLQVGEVDVIDTETCNNLSRSLCNRNWCGLRNQICAGKLTGDVDTCQGDSGGPLQVKIPLPITSQGSLHHLIGVTSFGVGCGRANTPGIYTRVSDYIDWIESIVWKES